MAKFNKVELKHLRKLEKIADALDLQKPIKVSVRKKGKLSNGIVGKCHNNVCEVVKHLGGKQVVGYYVQRQDDVEQTALLHHSIWLSPEGKYVDVTYDNYMYVKKGAAIKKIINKDEPTKTCRFAQFPNGEKGIIPKILMDLLKARKDTRKLIKTEPDEFKRKVLDGLQLAYKVTCNSVYGQMGASTSALCIKELAASTTAKGRNLLTIAKDFIVYKSGFWDIKSTIIEIKSNKINGPLKIHPNQIRS